MRCDEFEQMWNDALDARESPQHIPALTAHAALCSHCAELLNTSDLLARAFPAHEAVAPSDGWREATVRACVVERALQGLEPSLEQAVVPLAVAAPAASHRPRYLMAAVAAGLLIAIIAGRNWNRPANNGPQPEQLVTTPVPPPVLNKSTEVTPSITPATQSTLALASLKREQLSWVGYQVSDGLRPVTMGVSNAWQTIKRPLSKSEMETEVPQPQENGRSSSWVIVRECYV